VKVKISSDYARICPLVLVTGIGIDASDFSLLFEGFYRGVMSGNQRFLEAVLVSHL
jgi:hypothetical protein